MRPRIELRTELVQEAEQAAATELVGDRHDLRKRLPKLRHRADKMPKRVDAGLNPVVQRPGRVSFRQHLVERRQEVSDVAADLGEERRPSTVSFAKIFANGVIAGSIDCSPALMLSMNVSNTCIACGVISVFAR